MLPRISVARIADPQHKDFIEDVIGRIRVDRLEDNFKSPEAKTLAGEENHEPNWGYDHWDDKRTVYRTQRGYCCKCEDLFPYKAQVLLTCGCFMCYDCYYVNGGNWHESDSKLQAAQCLSCKRPTKIADEQPEDVTKVEVETKWKAYYKEHSLELNIGAAAQSDNAEVKKLVEMVKKLTVLEK